MVILGEQKEKSQASTLALAVLPSPPDDDMPDQNLRRIDSELRNLGLALASQREYSANLQNQLQDTLDELYKLATKERQPAPRRHPVTKRHRRVDDLSRPNAGRR